MRTTIGRIIERALAAAILMATGAAMGEPVHAAASETVSSVISTDRAQVTLISDQTAIHAGSAFWVGLRIKLAPGWHTYWRNPGDAGNPAKIDWDLPQGLVAGTIRWPQPERIPSGPLMSFGYHDSVVLLTRMSAFELPPGTETVEIRARASWLVCAEICVPEGGDLALSMPASAGTAPGKADEASEIEDFAKRLPGPTLTEGAFRISGGRFELSISIPSTDSARFEDVWFFPGEYGVVEHAAPQTWTPDAGVLNISLTPGESPVSPNDALEGLLAVRYEDGSEASWGITATQLPEN